MSVGTMRKLDETGDSKFTWDTDRPEEVQAARAQFDSLKAKGYLAFSVDPTGAKGSVMRSFDPEAGSVIMAPAVRGG